MKVIGLTEFEDEVILQIEDAVGMTSCVLLGEWEERLLAMLERRADDPSA